MAAQEQPPTSKAPILFAVLAIYLILKCLWRLIIPGGSYPMPPWHFIAMASDVMLAVVLVGLWLGLPASSPNSPAYVRHATPLFMGGMVAAMIIILLRFTSTHSWWTGHLLNGN